MYNEFFRPGGLDLKIKELSLITPYYYKGTSESILDLYFKITEKTISKGSDILIRYNQVLREALALTLSGLNYQYDDYEKRLLLNYTIGFFKIEEKKLLNKI